ncbi:Exocyst complex protein Exo70 [Corchorus capsularis]|uniref:Exocyst subunit Exo70 family protein n=1 Tax=Corchorus capsularis TaxID=210143 RepID=A0A1R3H2B4_COCAP|nr:Exocyst complex protein Exo70 [Corchorus capsularis]
MAANDEDSTLVKLESACSDLRTLLQTSIQMGKDLEEMERKFDDIDERLSTTAKRVAPLQSLAMAAKALETRINRAVSPALALLNSFKLSESLQNKLIELSKKLTVEKNPRKRLKKLLKYVECVDQLHVAINIISRDGEPVIQKLQEVVEFLSRTKATDHYRTQRLKETLVTLKVLYESEVEAMRFDGLLDEALLNLQDEFEIMLQQIKHQNIGEQQADDQEADQSQTVVSDLGTEMEVQVLKRIAEILAANDCLDICIDIFVKVRYRRAAKALMRLNPDYLRTYTAEEIDEVAWESLETAISLWIQHFELAVKTVFVSEKKLCNQVLGGLSEELVWLECFVKIADKIMAVFFRFGEGVARSNKEPQKLFKLLDMFDSLEKMKLEFADIFEGESGADICIRFRELEKLLVHASSKVFWEFGLQIEGTSDGFPPPQDGSVPKLVRYAVNYLKYLTSETYSVPMAKVFRTQQVWKAGILSKPESDENLLKDAIMNIMEALQRNIESKSSRYKDKILPHVFVMNTYWYIYMRSRNTELGMLLGEQYIKEKYKSVAEESAYMYQWQAWGPLVRLLDQKEDLQEEDINDSSRRNNGAFARGKMEAFFNCFDEISLRHREVYTIPDADLRAQLREATVKLVVPVYTEFLNTYSSLFPVKSYVSPESLQKLIGQVFNGTDRTGNTRVKSRDSKDRDRVPPRNSVSVDREVRILRRSRSNSIDV